jgi:hypothetical protein
VLNISEKSTQKPEKKEEYLPDTFIAVRCERTEKEKFWLAQVRRVAKKEDSDKEDEEEEDEEQKKKQDPNYGKIPVEWLVAAEKENTYEQE